VIQANRKEIAIAAGGSIAAAWLFFLEYLPPLRLGHLIWDADSYHYPLLNQAFQMLSRGEFPEWDPAIYCGSSLAGNIQAQLFYPPTWLLFAANALREGMTMGSVHVYVALHFALGLLLAWAWLRGRGIGRTASVCGALTFAFCGFRMSEVQHIGGEAAITWFPLAFLGVDQAVRENRWRPLWKVAVASAMCFLAGSPFVWVSFCLCTALYALASKGRRWVLPGSLAAISFSLLLSLVQILPAAETSGMQVRRVTFGNGGLPRAADYFTAIAPNYFDQARSRPPIDDEPFFYLGAPALFAFGWLLWRRKLLGAGPAFVLVAGSHLIMASPFGLVGTLFHYLSPLDRMVREWNLLACLPPAAALLGASAIDDFLRGKVSARPNRVLSVVALALIGGWCLRQMVIWSDPRQAFASGWASAAEAAVTVACLVVGMAAMRWESRPGWRTSLIAGIALTVFVDFKVYGTSRRFDYAEGNLDQMYADDARLGGDGFRGMDTASYQRMLTAPGYRVLDLSDPTVHDLRHYRLDTPQGNDPILPSRYRDALSKGIEWRSDRTFVFDPSDREWLDRLAVRWVLAIRRSPAHELALRAPHLRPLENTDTFTAAFEYTGAQPAWRYPAGTVRMTEWEGRARGFTVESPEGGTFRLLEVWYPGWGASVDGAPIQVRQAADSFQEVTLPGGRHDLRFEYRAQGLRAGALVSLAAWILVLLFVKKG
jgi:hypothetical protein